jgi:hypothetical protein
MSFYKGLFDALEARNRAQTSPDDMWIPTPWCSVGSDTDSAGHYYALPRLDPRLVGKVFGPDEGQTDGTHIICRVGNGGWEFFLSGTPRKSVVRKDFGHYSLQYEDRPSSGG